MFKPIIQMTKRLGGMETDPAAVGTNRNDPLLIPQGACDLVVQKVPDDCNLLCISQIKSQPGLCWTKTRRANIFFPPQIKERISLGGDERGG